MTFEELKIAFETAEPMEGIALIEKYIKEWYPELLPSDKAEE